MAIMKMAADNYRAKLSEYHAYADNTVDSPLLTPEVVLERKDDN